MYVINQDSFINRYIVNRKSSFFQRDINEFSRSLSRGIKGKSILVIGGAGTIGFSFIKALLPFQPGKLTVVDYSENGLTELTRDLRSQSIFMPEEYITYPFDFGSKVFEKMFRSSHYDIVACFAAHKHVRSEKDHLAIEAMITNNVINTHKLLDLCAKNPPEHFFSVSTDKATNPVNVMGASKKLMEDVLLSYSKDFKITTARFANVAFSNGSLLDGFNYRVSKQQPISAPEDVKRYFVSPEESGQLCLLACILGSSGDIFFPKLDEKEMKSFADIATNYLSYLGFNTYQCQSEEEARRLAEKWKPFEDKYPAYFFKSDTSGEKLFEEFYSAQDNVDFNRFHALGVINNPVHKTKTEIQKNIQRIKELFDMPKLAKGEIIEFLQKLITDFRHIETGKSLDHRM